LEGGVAGAQPLHKGGPKARPPRTAVVRDCGDILRFGVKRNEERVTFARHIQVRKSVVAE